MFRYRRLAPPEEGLHWSNPATGDMTFGHGMRNFHADSPAAVAQAVYTRLCLWAGEWWLNLSEGTPWLQQILGRRYSNVPDAAIRQRILGTPYVTQMTDYSSTFDNRQRTFTVSCKLYTSFGAVTAAPEGTLIAPSGALVMPLTARSGGVAATVRTPVPAVGWGR